MNKLPNCTMPRVKTVDALRGMAALAVCWHHLTGDVESFIPSYIGRISEYGWLGVQCFFVISGFVIPYSLYSSGYRVHDYGRFVIKRLIRLDPPYLLSLCIIIPLGYVAAATPGYKGDPYNISFMQVLLHFFYLNTFFGLPWLNGVFWTLAIEFQYYLFVGLAYPLIANKKPGIRILLVIIGSVIASLISSSRNLTNPNLLYWLPVFMLGMSAFQLRANIIGLLQFVLQTVSLFAISYYLYGVPIAITSIAAAVFIGINNSRIPRSLLFLGSISYSLYILHAPIGGRIVNFCRRFIIGNTFELALVLFVAISFTILISWVYYKYVESPAQRASKKIKYSHTQPQ